MTRQPPKGAAIRPVILVLGLLATTIARADDLTPPYGETPLNPQFHEPLSVTTVNETAIGEKQPVSTGEAILQGPGVVVPEAFAGGTGLTIRGLSGARNRILLNGIKLNNAITDTIPDHTLSRISPNLLGGATIWRTPASHLLGVGATGGVIGLSTRDATFLKNDHRALAGTLVSTGSHTGALLAGLQVGRGTWAVTAFTDYTGVGQRRDGAGTKIQLSDNQQSNWQTEITLRPKDSPLTVRGGYIGHFTNNGLLTDLRRAGTVTSLDDMDNLIYVGLDWDPNGPVKAFGIKAAYHQLLENSEISNCTFGMIKEWSGLPRCREASAFRLVEQNKNIVDTFGLTAQMKLASSDERAILASHIEYYFDNIMSSGKDRVMGGSVDEFQDRGRGRYSSGSYFSAFDAGLHGTVDLLRTKAGVLQASIGGAFSNQAAYAPVVPGVEEDIHYSFNGFVDEATLAFISKNIVNMYGTFSQGFRSPNLNETTALGTVNSRFLVPNKDLEPEWANNFEVGTKLNMAPLELGVAFFHNRIDQYIDEEPAMWAGRYFQNEVPVVRRVNAERAVFQGLETTLALHLYAITLAADLSWVDSRIDHKMTDYPDNFFGAPQQYPALATPAISGTGSLRYDDAERRFFTEFYVNWTGDQKQVHPMEKVSLAVCEDPNVTGGYKSGCHGQKGHYTLNLQGGFKITPMARLIVSLRNLTDQHYRVVGSKLDATGFDARGSLQFNF